MRFRVLLLGLSAAAFGLTSCVTEPAPSEPKVYGSVTTPKKTKTKTPKPARRDDTVTEITPR